MNVAEALRTATLLVDDDRAKVHGPREISLANIAELWNAYLGIRRDQKAPLDSSDVCKMMALLKIARMESGVFNSDNWIDACGYLAIGLELETETDPSVIPIISRKKVDHP